MSISFRPAMLLVLPSLVCAATAADKSAEPAKKFGESAWVFSLLPKSFQKNPNLDLTVIKMAEPEILHRRCVRDGNVEVGVPTVVEPAAPVPQKKYAGGQRPPGAVGLALSLSS